jgi:predicted anti-sigma-YlaC factor YlaD
MALSRENIEKLLNAVLRVSPGGVDCDRCMDEIHAFVERELQGKDIPKALDAVREHLEICQECREEYEALLAALRQIDENGS